MKKSTEISPKSTKWIRAISCKSEYGMLKKVLVCPPTYMKIKEIINVKQKFYIQENIDTGIAIKQFIEFVRILQKNKVNVEFLPTASEYPEQVFIRDVGFVIGDRIFISKMAEHLRSGEENILKQWLDNKNATYKEMASSCIEGGDVLVDGRIIWAGISDRTRENAVEELCSTLDHYKIIKVPIIKKYLHLDCVFNIISEDYAIIFPPAFETQAIKTISEHYNLIRVTAHEEWTLGVNVLSIGGKRIISQPVNKRLNRILERLGYSIIEVDLSEITKSGGSFRCITMPLSRE